MKIFWASDHAGLDLKKKLMTWIRVQHDKNSYEEIDLGCFQEDGSVDYPDYAEKLAHALKDQPGAWGVLLCGSGIGICMAANRFSHIRCAVCRTEEEAKLARSHNNANVIALGGRFLSFEKARDCLETFLFTSFEGGRHENRVAKLGNL